MESNRRPIFRAGVIDLGAETVTLPNGLTVELPIIRHPGAAAVPFHSLRQVNPSDQVLDRRAS